MLNQNASSSTGTVLARHTGTAFLKAVYLIYYSRRQMFCAPPPKNTSFENLAKIMCKDADTILKKKIAAM
jgi:hypothetical protein